MADTDTIHWRLIAGTAAKIAALNLPLITRDGVSRVYFQVWPGDVAAYSFTAEVVTDYTSPAVILTTEGEQENEGENNDTGTQDYRYPVRIWIVDRDKGHGKGPAYLAARKAIWDAMRDLTAMDEVPELVRCTVTPGVIFDAMLPQYQAMVSSLAARFETSEERA